MQHHGPAQQWQGAQQTAPAAGQEECSICQDDQQQSAQVAGRSISLGGSTTRECQSCRWRISCWEPCNLSSTGRLRRCWGSPHYLGPHCAFKWLQGAGCARCQHRDDADQHPRMLQPVQRMRGGHSKPQRPSMMHAAQTSRSHEMEPKRPCNGEVVHLAVHTCLRSR